MKAFRILLADIWILALLAGCGGAAEAEAGDTILATTYPMYYLTCRLTEGMEDITVEQMVTEQVSCIHDYSLTTEDMKKLERADIVVMNGAGLEDFMAPALEQIPPEKRIAAGDTCDDPHYWLDPGAYHRAELQVARMLEREYPEQRAILSQNSARLGQELDALAGELKEAASGLSCRQLITFHDGFASFAAAFGLENTAIEEEEGSEPSAAQLKEICGLIGQEHIPAIFVEKNGSTSAAELIARETGVKIFILTTVMDGETDYITAMKENIRTVGEALS